MSDPKDPQEKTVVATGDTFSGQIREASDTPPMLVCLVGPENYAGRQWPLTLKEYVIGRSAESTIYVNDASVSRGHAMLLVDGSEVSLMDMGSSNKTAVGNKVLEPKVPVKLRNNDQVRTGNVLFKFLEQGNIEALGIQQLALKAERDALTGAYSKRALLEKAPEFIKRSDFLNEPMSILAFDLDHFKKTNDQFGHAGGDLVLSELGKIVLGLIRGQDYFARYGGEEFVVVIAASTERNSDAVAERIRATIEAHQFEYDGKRIPTTVSMGIAHRRPGEGFDSLYRRADEACYRSKNLGRNRVTVDK